MKISKRIKTVLAILLTVGLVWFLAMQVNLADVIQIIQQMPISLLLASFGLYVLGHLGRTIRFYKLLGWKNGFHELFSIVALHNLFINTLPARTGELSYLYMTKKRDVSIAKSGSVLVIARILDMIAIAVILLVAVIMVPVLPAFLATVSYFVAGLLVVSLFMLFSLVHFGKHFMSGLGKLFSLFRLGKTSIAKWVLEKGDEAIDSFKVLKSKGSFFEHLFYSLFIWGVRFVLFWLITIGLGVEVGIWVGIIGITLPMLSTFLPIQGLGGFGTLEGAWVLSFMSLGIAKEVAILTGFGFHIVFLTFSIITGVYGFMALSLIKKLTK
tara:strand:- start:692 stop:1669 length:978 start_codon:yes stop_codon:yes gene_type:complete